MNTENYQAKVEQLNEKLVNLTLSLQREVKELKEDTILNAQHINALKNKHQKEVGVVNNALSSHINNTNEIIDAIAEHSDEKETSNYTDFLKNLLESDFKAEQTEMIDEAKREILNIKPKTNDSNSSLNIGLFFNVLSTISFVLVVFICYKYKLLFFAS